MSRIEYEKRVVRVMIGIYCRAHHHSEKGLCRECEELAAYYERRVERCPLGEEKLSCKVCTIHCSEHQHRQKIREVMRYAGPRMIYSHPLMAFRHLYYEMIKPWLRCK
ncbi:MAG: nitrous oxide-stimulated promoter family protein [Alistipes sp.]|nr:nitrous oxide-stimulated promoter family protein [Alistipes sp.]